LSPGGGRSESIFWIRFVRSRKISWLTGRWSLGGGRSEGIFRCRLLRWRGFVGLLLPDALEPIWNFLPIVFSFCGASTTCAQRIRIER
jgi:hypothetical protein